MVVMYKKIDYNEQEPGRRKAKKKAQKTYKKHTHKKTKKKRPNGLLDLSKSGYFKQVKFFFIPFSFSPFYIYIYIFYNGVIIIYI